MASANGLETTLTCWLLTLLVVELVSGRALEKPLLATFVSAGLVAARPEGIAVALALGVTGLALERGSRSWVRRCAWLAGAIGAEVVIVAARLAYYGQLLSNTYYAKHMPLDRAIHQGLNYLSGAAPGVPWFVSVVEGAVALVGAVALGRGQRRWTYALVAVVTVVLAVLATGGDWMLGDRFLVPVAPIFAVVTAAGVVTLVGFSAQRLPFESRLVHRSLCALLAVIVCLFAVLPLMKRHDPVWHSSGHFDDVSLTTAGGYGILSTVVWPTGLEFLRCAPAGSLVAYSEDGLAAFERPDLRFLDLRGLNDLAIAHDSPPQDKSFFGVSDPEWAAPQSVTGAEIRRTHPALVVDTVFDNLGGDAEFLAHHGYVEATTPGATLGQSVDVKLWVRLADRQAVAACGPRPAPHPARN